MSDATDDVAPVDGGPQSARLSVNLPIEDDAILKKLIADHGMTITQGIRRSIRSWKRIQDAIDSGKPIGTVQRSPDNKIIIIREFDFLD